MLLVEDKLCILGDWDNSYVPDNRIPIKLKPAYVFGTGHHPTTFQFLSTLCSIPSWKHGPSYEVLDVGCGSGILSIASAKLGATTVYSKDISPAAINLSGENVLLNQVSNIVEVSTGTYLPRELPTGYLIDLVLCNINSSDVLLDILSYSKDALFLGGKLIVSYAPQTFTLEDHLNGYKFHDYAYVAGPRGGWVVAVLERNDD